MRRTSKKHLLAQNSRPGQRAGKVRPVVEELEARCLLSVTGFRPIDEVGNNPNPADQNWGAYPIDQPGGAPIQLLRVSVVAYADGISMPSLANDPSARLISNILNNQADPSNPGVDLQTVNQESLSDFAYAFGQFMDHDMDLTPDGGASFPIPVPAGDPIGPGPLPFTRSQTDPTTGTSTSNPAEQINDVTSFLDLSQVYGSDQATADALRTMTNGQLKMSPGGLLPYDNSTYFSATQLAAINQALGGMQNAGALPSNELFVTGDIRGNENVELTALQTLFVRNHNRIAAQLQGDHPGWTDEQLYQEARKLNIAQYQSIVYNEWIPAVLGSNALGAYTGYNSSVNPSIATEFSTVAFRFGHSMLSNSIQRQDNNGNNINVTGGAPINLAKDFFDPNMINNTGAVDNLTGQAGSNIGPILKGDADGDAQATDILAINEVRNLLFGSFGAGGQDLIARDVQRGRDDGIGSYNQVRMAYGLAPAGSFADITTNLQLQQELAQAYPGGVGTVDAFEGGMAEDHYPGADVGPLFRAIMVDQFSRLRSGDRFFYLNESFNLEELSILLQGNTLTKVIEANTDVRNLQADAFIFRASISGTVFTLNGFHFGVAPGITVELEDTSGDVLGTTVTDARGNYRFNQLSGPSGNPDNASGVSATGDYDIVLVLPSGTTQLSPSPNPIHISRGDTNVFGVSFLISNDWGWWDFASYGGGSQHHS